MILFIILLIISSILSGVCEAIMDALNFNFYGSVFSKLNPKWWHREESANNKDVEGSKLKKILYKTVLVFTTDGWHLFKALHSLFLFCIMGLSYLLATNLIFFIGIFGASYFLKKIIFEYSYKLFHKKSI